MAEETPQPWELMRVLEQIREDVRAMRAEMLTTAVFKVWQDATERRFAEVEKDQQAWTVESRGEHVRLDAKVDTLRVDLTAQLDAHREKQDSLERAARESRARVWLAIGVAILGFLSSIGAGVMLRGMGA